MLNPYRPIPGQGVKINAIFGFHTFCGPSEGFYEGSISLFQILFELPQRSVRINVYVNFISTNSFETLGTGRAKQT